MKLKLLILLSISIILFLIINKYYKSSIENFSDEDYGNILFSKKKKQKLKSNNIFFIEKGYIKKNIINPLNTRIDKNMKILNNVFGLFNQFLNANKMGQS